MYNRCLFLTSDGLSDNMKIIIFFILVIIMNGYIGKQKMKVLELNLLWGLG